MKQHDNVVLKKMNPEDEKIAKALISEINKKVEENGFNDAIKVLIAGGGLRLYSLTIQIDEQWGKLDISYNFRAENNSEIRLDGERIPCNPSIATSVGQHITMLMHEKVIKSNEDKIEVLKKFLKI